MTTDTVYMVVDCGGGTVDITVHQMTDTKAGHLKELHKATGGPYGSTGTTFEKYYYHICRIYIFHSDVWLSIF